jgi:hypothetical protein
MKQRSAMESPQNLQFRFVHCECCLFSIANFLQIISPIALAIAYYSMPQTVIPVRLDPKYFTAVILFIMVWVKLLFVVLCAMPSRPWWWKKITAWMKKLPLDEMGHSWLVLRRGRNYPDRATDIRTTEGMEMTLAV